MNRYARPAFHVAALMLGALTAVGTIGRESESMQRLSSQYVRFQQLADADKRQIIASQNLLLTQATPRQQQYREIHAAVSSDAGLARTLQRFGEIWGALSQQELEEWARLDGDRESKRAFIITRMQDPAPREIPLEVQFSGTYSRMLPSLHLTSEEYWDFLCRILPPDQHPPNLLTELNGLSLEQKALSLSLWIVEYLPAEPNEDDSRNIIQYIRRAEEFLETSLKDQDWMASFAEGLQSTRGTRRTAGWSVPVIYTVIIQSITMLGEQMSGQFPIGEEQMLEQFSQMSSSERTRLMPGTPLEFRQHLEYLARRNPPGKPEHALLKRYTEFAQNKQQITRRQWFSLVSIMRKM